ncbi:hypothetical protein SYJ56_24560 [Algoriphagus sp. D3-2-R+10]|uniref:hypothetical protein n=1 Tax=Algoriphagus aurantiacus TaxID=3103948 RepID=UPI002B3D576C|nr:hypothetical protein [Algoriphagus sp. D3-2-R+10]MEB2778504.1 hypothetical protein [Algoriphagus sp. D3-2-R+10]
MAKITIKESQVNQNKLIISETDTPKSYLFDFNVITEEPEMPTMISELFIEEQGEVILKHLIHFIVLREFNGLRRYVSLSVLKASIVETL